MVITDKVVTQNGADFMFVCGKIPFAVSSSSDLPHRNHNMIDLDLINKMKIPLKNIRVTKICVQGHDLRCVGVVSQTIQCVGNGKISGTIHLYAKVVRDLFNSISVDCLASRRTFSRLMGEEPMEEPPDDLSIEVLGGEEILEDKPVLVRLSDYDGDDVRPPDVEGDDVRPPDVEGDDVQPPTAEGDDVLMSNEEDDAIIETKKVKYDEAYLNYVCSLPIYQPPQTTLREWRKIPKFGTIKNVMTYETSPGDCVVSSSEDDQTDVEHEEETNITETHMCETELSARPVTSKYRTSFKSQSERHCQFCFLSGQPIKVTVSHSDMDIECPSMSDFDRVRIHGEKKTNQWLARMHGYNE